MDYKGNTSLERKVENLRNITNKFEFQFKICFKKLQEKIPKIIKGDKS